MMKLAGACSQGAKLLKVHAFAGEFLHAIVLVLRHIDVSSRVHGHVIGAIKFPRPGSQFAPLPDKSSTGSELLNAMVMHVCDMRVYPGRQWQVPGDN